MPHVATLFPGRWRSGGAPDSGLSTVQPLSSQLIHDSYFVCAQSQWTVGPYTATSAWVERLAEMGVKQFRGVFVETNPSCQATIQACRDFGVKWVMLVVPERPDSPTAQTIQQTTNRINWIADNAADICVGIEGLNEPNQNRADGSTTPGWQVPAYDHQVAIWNTVQSRSELSGLTIYGPSLHDVKAAANNGEHYALLASTGIANYMHRLGIHRYPNARDPEADLTTRLSLVYSAFGQDFPIAITETGYHTGLDVSSGHYGTSEVAASIYGPRALFGIAGQRGIEIMRYALLDHEHQNYSDPEANFGMIRVGQTVTDSSAWTLKPEYIVMSSTLERLNDPGPSYVPDTVQLNVTGPADMRHVVTAKRNGQATVWLWREQPVWDRVSKQDLVVEGAQVTVAWPNGSASFAINGSVASCAIGG